MFRSIPKNLKTNISYTTFKHWIKHSIHLNSTLPRIKPNLVVVCRMAT
uniref:Uncharacterized protein n=1 Tax=Rhizophora mucronata TaxID=61149 RepID=A0A2P2NHL3_RHIMU